MAKQTTRWQHVVFMKNGPLVRTGRVYNNDPHPEDVIRLQIWDAADENACDVSMTVDEAVHISSCLMRTTSKAVTGKVATAIRKHYANNT